MKSQQYEALDSIDYYNKKYITKEKLETMAKISGSFMKVRSQGGASSKDIDEVNKFYKRAFVSMFLLMAHSYITINFLYDARFVTAKSSPRLYSGMPYVVYPVVLIGSILYMFNENSRMMGQLDRKYTPLWLEISKKI